MKTYFVVFSMGYWGRGETEEAAFKQWRKAGGKFAGGFEPAAILYRIECEAGKDPPFVDDCGCMNWHGERVKVAEFNKRGKRKEIAEAAAG